MVLTTRHKQGLWGSDISAPVPLTLCSAPNEEANTYGTYTCRETLLGGSEA